MRAAAIFSREIALFVYVTGSSKNTGPFGLPVYLRLIDLLDPWCLEASLFGSLSPHTWAQSAPGTVCPRFVARECCMHVVALLAGRRLLGRG